ncbi:hypothetical protein BD779DRAFT_1442856, partial [Infundibulicybe gibba]
VKRPSPAEMKANITNLLGPGGKPTPAMISGCLVGQQLMIDGIALEEVCRYDISRNEIIGLCREHTDHITTELTSFAVIKAIEKALYKDKTCCHGKDGTVVAIASVAGSQHYTPVPVLLSPSCKTEKSTALGGWLQTFLDVYRDHQHGQAIHGPIWSLASDGEASFRAARFSLCMSRRLDSSSTLGERLRLLPGLNFQTGPYGILGTCDPKHVIKRFATLLRNKGGLQVGDATITSLDIVQSLLAFPEMTLDKAQELMNPADKQNVPKAVSLIQELLRLADLPVPLAPNEARRRKSIIFIAKALGFFLLPFISIDMDLASQVRHLSAYAHLTAAMYLKHGLSFITGALYADSQAIIKDIVFTIARLQGIDQNIPYYIIHAGTDRLEGVFSDVRTQDHSRNFDALQLAQKLSVSAEINATFERNPDLDRGHRRLALTDAKGIDHVNPRSWTGNVRVGDVDLVSTWEQGRDMANHLLVDEFDDSKQVDFVAIFSQPDIDLLRPTGTYVGSQYSPDDDRSEADAELCNASAQSTPNSSEHHVATDLGTLSEETALEDLLEIEEVERTPEANNFVKVDGVDYYKSSLVAAFLTPKGARKVTMRTLRARGITIEQSLRPKNDNLNRGFDSPDRDGGDWVKAGDLVASLVRLETGIPLAVIEVSSFEYSGSKNQLTGILTNVLEDPHKRVMVIGQILEMIPYDHSSSNETFDWIWTHEYLRFGARTDAERSTQNQHTVRMLGTLAHPLAPSVIRLHTAESNQDAPLTWSIPNSQLSEIMEYAWAALNREPDKIVGNVGTLPRVSYSTLPYQNEQGEDCLFIQDLPECITTKKISTGDQVDCFLCGKKSKLKAMRDHVGRHILRALREIDESSELKPGMMVGVNPCGWCGRDTCAVQLTKKHGSKSVSVASNCIYHYENMSYSQASKCTNNSPCTNIPIHCPICPVSSTGQPPTFWKYNGLYHLAAEHPEENNLPEIPPLLLVEIFITSREERLMGIDQESTSEWRDDNKVPDTDEVEETRADLKRERAESAVSGKSSKKVARRK